MLCFGSKCLDLGEEDDIGAGMWAYQSCTEMVLTICFTIEFGTPRIEYVSIGFNWIECKYFVI